MIYEILEEFKKQYDKFGEKLIIDNYKLKEGLYVKIGTELEYFIVKKVKKEIIFSDVDGMMNIDMEEWFKSRDYYSGYIDSNKAFYDKKIHNINYYTFFAKIDSFINPDKMLSKEVIKQQFKNLCTYKKFIKPQEKAILKEFNFNDRSRKKEIIKIYRKLISTLDIKVI